MWHELSEEEALSKLLSNMESGLSEEYVKKCRLKYGYNEISKPEKISLITMVLEQFQDLMVIILLVITVVSAIIKILDNEEGLLGFVEPTAILLILIANAIISAWQEFKLESALEALKNFQPEYVKCLREGQWKQILSRELVPGDIVQITVGDKVSADLRLLKLLTPSFKVDQSSLIGDGEIIISKYPITKTKEEYTIEKPNIVYSSSYIICGTGIAVVIETGIRTTIGAIAETSKNRIDDFKTFSEEKEQWEKNKSF